MPTALDASTNISIVADDQSYVDELLSPFSKADRRRVFVHVPTGAGKTLVSIGLADQLKNEQLGAFFVVVSAASLPWAATFVHDAVRRHQLDGLLVRDEAPEWIPQLLDRAGLRTLRNTLVHSHVDRDMPRRVLQAHILGAQDELIADARALDDRLLILTCGLDTIEVPFESITALARLAHDERTQFEISEDGSRISWPSADLDFDIESLRYAVDEQYRNRVDRERLAYSRQYGQAIRAFREEKGLRQKDIEGLSERQVRRIEKEGTTSSEALRVLACAHSMSLNDYLNEIAERAA